MGQIFLKDPNAILDYTINWVHWLATAETIATSTWAVTPATLTITASTNTTTTATAWVSGGVAGVEYALRNRIVTNQARTEDRTIYLVCQER